MWAMKLYTRTTVAEHKPNLGLNDYSRVGVFGLGILVIMLLSWAC